MIQLRTRPKPVPRIYRRLRPGVVVATAAAATVLGCLPAPSAWAFRQGDMPDFVVSCTFSHRLPDDPIVHPGAPGASHMHDFFGNTAVDALSTYSQLRKAPTTCARPADTAGYWMPTAYQNGVVLRPLTSTVYYRDMALDPAMVQAFPANFRMVAGDHDATSPQRPLLVGWACRHASDGLKGLWTSDVPTCGLHENLVFRVRFPDCWNGHDLDSSDHMSHVAYSKNGVCPAGFPVAVPRVSMTVAYDSHGGSGVTLSSGSALTGHADFWNTWKQSALQNLVVTCLRAGIHCGFGTASNPQQAQPDDI
jgi:hypothetical protein